jgi:hypothetical protein
MYAFLCGNTTSVVFSKQHVNIPWFSMPLLGFCHGSGIAKKEAYDVLVYVYVV